MTEIYMNHVKIIFFGFVMFSSCTENSSNEKQNVLTDSQSRATKHEDLHVQFHDTTKASHNGDVGLTEILPDMNNHIRNIHKTNSIDRDFIVVLNTFHQAEMEMAYRELVLGKSPELKILALEIKNDRQFSNLDLYCQQEAVNETDTFYKEITLVLRNQPGPKSSLSNSIDSQFAAYLEYHHERALEIMPVFFKFSLNNQLRLLINKIGNIYRKRLLELKKVRQM